MGFRIERSVLVGGAFLVGGTAIQSIVGLCASILLARLIGPEAFGRFAVVFATVGLSLAILTLRLPILITRATTDELSGPRGNVYLTVLFAETAAVGALSLAWLTSAGMMDQWALIIVVSQCLSHWLGANKAFYERTMRYRRLAAVETGTVVASHVLAVAAALGGAGEAALYLRELAAALLLLVGLAGCGGLTFRPLRWPSYGEIVMLIRDARSVWLDGVLEGSFQRLTILTASWVGGERETGYFFMAQSLAMRPHQLIAPFATRVAANWIRTIPDSDARRRSRDWLLGWAAGSLLVMAALVVLLADPVVPAILGSQWQGAVPVLIAMSGVIVFLTSFEILRVYGFVVRHDRDVLTSRIAQYGGFAATVVVAAAVMPGVVALGLAVSIAFGAACAALWLNLARTGRR